MKLEGKLKNLLITALITSVIYATNFTYTNYLMSKNLGEFNSYPQIQRYYTEIDINNKLISGLSDEALTSQIINEREKFEVDFLSKFKKGQLPMDPLRYSIPGPKNSLLPFERETLMRKKEGVFNRVSKLREEVKSFYGKIQSEFKNNSVYSNYYNRHLELSEKIWNPLKWFF